MQGLDDLCHTSDVRALDADALAATAGGDNLWFTLICKGFACGPVPDYLLGALKNLAAEFAAGAQEGWAAAGG